MQILFIKNLSSSDGTRKLYISRTEWKTGSSSLTSSLQMRTLKPQEWEGYAQQETTKQVLRTMKQSSFKPSAQLKNMKLTDCSATGPHQLQCDEYHCQALSFAPDALSIGSPCHGQVHSPQMQTLASSLKGLERNNSPFLHLPHKSV